MRVFYVFSTLDQQYNLLYYHECVCVCVCKIGILCTTPALCKVFSVDMSVTFLHTILRCILLFIYFVSFKKH